MAAPTAVEAAEAVDDDIYRSSALIFVVAEPSDERMVRTKDTLCRPRCSLGVPARHGTTTYELCTTGGYYIHTVVRGKC